MNKIDIQTKIDKKQRFNNVVKELNLQPAELSKITGIRLSNICDYLDMKNTSKSPGGNFALSLEKSSLKINSAYILKGELPMFLDSKTIPEAERPDWLKNLTENEELNLQKLIEKDKELLLFLFNADTGEPDKVKLFVKYMAFKYNIKVRFE